MHDLPGVLARLQALRSKFESLLASARKKAVSAPDCRPPRLQEITGFAANPGNLRMFAYAPAHLPPGAPLIVALHGCTQSADEYDCGTGWSSLADRFGFAIVYPQQQPANNPKNCFSWFLPGDTARGHGEARSIHAMVEHAIAKFASDRTRIFVTGLSAGGAMASVMLATYPDLFAGGAIIAGLPYGCARNAQQAFEAMFAAKGDCAEVLGDRVRAASGHCGPWPKISIWHGAADPIVKPANCDAIVRQWTNVHGLSDSPAYEERIGSHTRQVWSDEQGEPLIEVFSIDNMAHGVPLGIATGGESCGAAGAFFLDAGISSTHHIARFWGLHKSAVKKRRVAASAPAPSALPRDQGARAMVRTRPETSQASAEDTAGARDEPQSHHAFDPNRVIAAAFQAAGLAAPPKTAPGASSRIDPAPIIAAALKAAGLTKN